MLTLPTGTPAYRATPTHPTRGLVIAPDIGGLRPLFTDMCDRLAAEHGWAVIAVEPWPGREDLSWEERLSSASSLDDAALVADVIAAADVLGTEPVAVLGFCMGGMVALKTAATGRVDRAVAFYGMIRLPESWRSATMGDALDTLTSPADGIEPAPILFLTGTADPLVPADDVDALEAFGAEVVRYPGADHGFVHDPSRPTHRPDDSADAWRRAITFLS